MNELEKSGVYNILHKYSEEKAEIKECTDIANDLGMESIEIFSATFEIEDLFDIKINEQDLKGIDTVDALFKLIDMKIKAKKIWFMMKVMIDAML